MILIYSSLELLMDIMSWVWLLHLPSSPPQHSQTQTDQREETSRVGHAHLKVLKQELNLGRLIFRLRFYHRACKVLCYIYAWIKHLFPSYYSQTLRVRGIRKIFHPVTLERYFRSSSIIFCAPYQLAIWVEEKKMTYPFDRIVQLCQEVLLQDG